MKLSFLKISLIIPFLISTSFASDIRGKWQGKDYSITLSDTFEYVRGNWGSVQYDLRVSETFQYVRGSIDGQDFELRFSDVFTYVRGDLPCGEVDYSYSTTFNYVRGTLCGDDFVINLQNEDEVIPVAQETFLQEILSEFPRPARSAIESFIMRRIKL